MFFPTTLFDETTHFGMVEVLEKGQQHQERSTTLTTAEKVNSLVT